MSGYVDILDDDVWREESFDDPKAASEKTRRLYERARVICHRVGKHLVPAGTRWAGRNADLAGLQISAWTT
jgi:hypothetical protein